jgi:hypothetical protein
LKYSGDLAKGNSEMRLNACQGGRGENGAVSTEFKRDKHMLFETTTPGIARVRGTTPFVWSMGNVLSQIVCLLCTCAERPGRGDHRSAWNTVRLTNCRWLMFLDCYQLELPDCRQLELSDCRQLSPATTMPEVICSAGRQVYVNDHPT